MKKPILLAAALLASAAMLTGCVSGKAPFECPKGLIYAEYTAPLTTDAKVDFGTKKGTSTNKAYVGLITTGDASVKAAAEDAGIKTVKHVEYSYKNVVFFVYQETTVIVYGD